MVKGMGESCFEDLLPWLMETLTYEQSSVDRFIISQMTQVLILFYSVLSLEVQIKS